MLPKFPAFKRIELSDREDIEAYTKLLDPYSDYNFTCLWIWDCERERMVSDLNGNLVVKFSDYHSHEKFMSYLGVHDVNKTVDSLIKYCKEIGLSTNLRFIPEISIKGLDKYIWKVEENQRDFDYILSIENLASLSGGLYEKKRTKVNKFWRSYPSAKFEVVKLGQKKNTDANHRYNKNVG